MSLRMRLFWLGTLPMFLCGCSGFHAATWPEVEAPVPDAENGRTVQAGKMVQVRLASGEEVTGEVLQITEDLLSLRVRVRSRTGDADDIQSSDYFAAGPETRAGRQPGDTYEKTVLRDSIEWIKVEGSSPVRTVFLCIGVGLAAALVGAGISLSSNGIM
jgi:hypothetical protein